MRRINKIIKSEGTGNISPFIDGVLAQELAPFVLFDAVHATTDKTWGFDWHPHSGVATLTYIYGATLNHQDSGGNNGAIYEGGFQWMQAGNGIWHKEYYEPKEGRVNALQLWVQLSPGVEDQPNRYFDRSHSEIPKFGDNVDVLVGSLGEVEADSPIPVSMTYLNVALSAGDKVSLPLADDQRKGIVYVVSGSVNVGGSMLNEMELGILSNDGGELNLQSSTESRLIVAVVKDEGHPLVAERGQVHTNRESLVNAAKNIQSMARSIRG